MSISTFHRTVLCLTAHSKKKLVPAEKLEFRPGAYAVICRFKEGKILLIRGKHNGRFSLPGGGIELGEPMVNALRREVYEETGLAIEVGEFFSLKEGFFYFDPEDKAYHVLGSCWECSVADDATIRGQDTDEGTPEWVDVFSLKEEDCHGFTYEVFQEFWEKHRLWKYRPAASE